jgi:ATP/maltotriose-dependent transcriptional regulator MalT
MKLRQYRQQENQGRRGHAGSSDLSWSGPEERLLAAVASAVTLIEATARIQRETVEVLLALAQRDDNETGVQRLKRVDDTLRALTAAAPDSQLALLDGPNGRVLAEPLTAREITVLRLLRGTLTRREMAQELCLSANTIKSHVRAVYRKLGVSSRRDAIQRGRELGIL